jgi:hypothetical protein
VATSAKAVASSSLRCEIHATDSTRVGCRANAPAANAAGHSAPVAARSTPNTSSAFSACSAAFTACGPPGVIPNHSTSTHVREPRERDPVAGVEARQRARDVRAREPVAHDRVLDHVHRVVELDEVEAGDGAIGPRDREHERRRDRELAPPDSPLRLAALRHRTRL